MMRAAFALFYWFVLLWLIGCAPHEDGVVLRERLMRRDDRDCNVAVRVLRTNRTVVWRLRCGYAVGDTVVLW